jgi:hypothetical protein
VTAPAAPPIDFMMPSASPPKASMAPVTTSAPLAVRLTAPAAPPLVSLSPPALDSLPVTTTCFATMLIAPPAWPLAAVPDASTLPVTNTVPPGALSTIDCRAPPRSAVRSTPATKMSPPLLVIWRTASVPPALTMPSMRMVPLALRSAPSASEPTIMAPSGSAGTPGAVTPGAAGSSVTVALETM